LDDIYTREGEMKAKNYALLLLIILVNTTTVYANECEYKKGLVNLKRVITDVFEEEKGMRFFDVDEKLMFHYSGKVIHTKKTFIECTFSILPNGRKTVLTQYVEEDIKLTSHVNFKNQ
jgi:hypothetical protein